MTTFVCPPGSAFRNRMYAGLFSSRARWSSRWHTYIRMNDLPT
eukprot:CAMPEP_0169484210 /NCGR_PEP_ID=MMETSP1042-20121227/31620_1 /TAXON_ID=464988 /ORGANISM="Hemiselmis andersenii, Strain CCMP1180" /LENGTH=42 /DNA_ID= /DNA_START= /DNA_END= /DNA_ORIENTATION=